MKYKRKMLINRPGGSASKKAIEYRISIPAEVIKKLGITEDDRDVTLEVIDGKIVIEKRGK